MLEIEEYTEMEQQQDGHYFTVRKGGFSHSSGFSSVDSK